MNRTLNLNIKMVGDSELGKNCVSEAVSPCPSNMLVIPVSFSAVYKCAPEHIILGFKEIQIGSRLSLSPLTRPPWRGDFPEPP